VTETDLDIIILLMVYLGSNSMTSIQKSNVIQYWLEHRLFELTYILIDRLYIILNYGRTRHYLT